MHLRKVFVVGPIAIAVAVALITGFMLYPPSVGWTVTFTAPGLEGVTGPVLIADGKNYTLQNLPLSLHWTTGTYKYTWITPLNVSGNERFVYVSTASVITQKTADGSTKTQVLTATYVVEYLVTVQVTGNESLGGFEPGAGEYWVRSGSVFACRAALNVSGAGYTFLGNIESGSTDQNDLQETINEPVTVQASLYVIIPAGNESVLWPEATALIKNDGGTMISIRLKNFDNEPATNITVKAGDDPAYSLPVNTLEPNATVTFTWPLNPANYAVGSYYNLAIQGSYPNCSTTLVLYIRCTG